MNKLISTIVALLGVVVLPLGTASAMVSISNTGPNSSNEITVGNSGGGKHSSSYENDVDANVGIEQDAETGNAYVSKNTNAGDAETGDAENENDITAELMLHNGSGDGCYSGCHGADIDASIDTTGPNSSNTIKIRNGRNVHKVKSNNDINLQVGVNQDAKSGNATNSKNTNGGSATTGNASNSNSTDIEIEAKNDNSQGSACCHSADISASIDTTGYNSTNTIKVGTSGSSKSEVNLKNEVSIDNSVNQTSASGNAKVQMNTNAGDATTGNASNSNSTSISLHLSN